MIGYEDLPSFVLRREDTSTDPYPLPEDDARDWSLVSSGNRFLSGSSKAVLEDKRIELRNRARWAVRFNPHGRAILRNTVKYVLGRGVVPKWRDGDPDEVKDFWKLYARMSKWKQRSRETLVRFVRDGEVLKRRFSIPLEDRRRRIVVTRFIDPELIRDPDTQSEEAGVRTDPDDVEMVLGFRKVKAADLRTLDAEVAPEDVIFVRAEADMNERRGTTPLAAVLRYVEMYDAWLVERMILSKVRSAVALVRTYDATKGQIKAELDAEQSREKSERGWRGETKPIANESAKQKKFRPGTVINARQGVDYKFINPNLQAADVHHDGRAILLAIASGTGLAEFMVSADASQNSYSNGLVAEGPAVKEFEDIHEILDPIYTQEWVWAVEYAQDRGMLPRGYDPWGMVWAWPDMVSRNRLHEVQGNSIMVSARAMSRQTMMERDGLDPDVELKRIEAEKLMGLPDPPPAGGQTNDPRTRGDVGNPGGRPDKGMPDEDDEVDRDRDGPGS